MESELSVSQVGGTEGGPMKEGAPQPPPQSPGSGRSSPPPDCAICLGQCKNKSFTDSCLHQFCFHCLLTWSKIKAECPLCKQAFKSIIHNVKSNHQYEEYLVEQQHPAAEDFLEVDYYETPRFRYRTTLTLHRHEGLALERLLMRYPLVPLGALPSSLPAQPPPARHTRRSRPGLFRQSVYRHNLWARPLPDITGRHRECSPEFYRHNPAQIHRLVPWLTRELAFLIPDATHVLARILDTLTVFPILSAPFRQMMMPYLNVYTDHFLHEFYSFASSPFDMVGYDCAVQYQPGGTRASESFINEVLSSSDGENSTDSDIVMVSPAAGPSNAFPVPFAATPPADPSTSNRRLGSLSNSVIAIETMSHSDTEDSSDEVVMVGYIKPPHERTPEVVDLLASDSDTVIIEEPRVSSPIEVVDEHSLPAQASFNNFPGSSSHPSSDLPSSSGLVKLSLKRNRNLQSAGQDSDSEDDSNYTSKRIKRFKTKHRKHRPVSRDSASTECTDRDTDYSDVDCTQDEQVSDFTNDLSVSSLSESEVPRKRMLNKSKQSLASEILKKFKMNLRRHRKDSRSESMEKNLDSDMSYRDSEYEESSSRSMQSSSSSSKRKSRKKFKRKNSRSADTASNSSKNTESQKLKFKSRSKSKEKMIIKIFENKQTKNVKGKAGMSSKSKAKNKCFVKSSNRNTAEVSGPSTSRVDHSGTESDVPLQLIADEADERRQTDSDTLREETPSTSSTLLDIVSKSILSPNNPVLSINSENSPGPSYIHDFSNDIVASLLNQFDENFFECSDRLSPHPKPLNLSANKEIDDSFG